MRLYSEYFFGILLILVGVLLIVRHVFNIHIPLLRILFGLFFLYIGFSIIFGGFTGFSTRNDNNMVFSSGIIKINRSANDEYNLIFSNGELDFTDIAPGEDPGRIKINVIFSSGTIRLNPKTPAVVKINSAFANASTPDNTNISFGSHVYSTKAAASGVKSLEIDANAVFSSLKFK